jgi:U4/U6 small nuclear ribonucleoprotein PRP3
MLAPDAVAKVQAIASRLAASAGAAAGAAPHPSLLRAPTGFSAAPPAAAAAPVSARARPVALRLDAAGREVDESGAVLAAREVRAVTSFKVNARANRAQELAAAMEEARREVAAEAAAGGGGVRVRGRGRDTRALHFVEPGALTHAAEASRVAAALRAQFGDASGEAAKRAAARAKRAADTAARYASYETAGAEEGGGGADAPEIVPDVEWWDAPLLGGAGASYDAVLSGGGAALASGRISCYVEHPVPLPPPAEAPPPPPQPLKLTAKEQKKLRTQRRLAREKERQEMLRQGLLEPPPPKVRIANLMRVLGAEATADPTAVEREVRAQMAERAAAHEDRNAARALTPAERREKHARKLFEDAHGGGGELLCAVYRIERINHPLNEYKIVINAEENHLSGCGIKTDAFAIVIVQGARKAINRYAKLMLRRIDWSLRKERASEVDPSDGDALAAAEAEDAEAEAAEAAAPNKCVCVWQGAVLEAAFKRFKFEPIRSAGGAAKFLEDVGLRHFWDLAAAGVAVE